MSYPMRLRRLTTKLSGAGHRPASYGKGASAARGRGPLQREFGGSSTDFLQVNEVFDSEYVADTSQALIR